MRVKSETKTVILSVAITANQLAALKELSQRTGQSVSNLVRQAINLVMGVYGSGQEK